MDINVKVSIVIGEKLGHILCYFDLSIQKVNGVKLLLQKSAILIQTCRDHRNLEEHNPSKALVLPEAFDASIFGPDVVVGAGFLGPAESFPKIALFGT